MDGREQRSLGERVCMLGLAAVLVLLSVEGGAGQAERVSMQATLSPGVSPERMARAGGGRQTTVGTGLFHPYGVAVDHAGTVYIADSGHNRVVKVPAGR